MCLKEDALNLGSVCFFSWILSVSDPVLFCRRIHSYCTQPRRLLVTFLTFVIFWTNWEKWSRYTTLLPVKKGNAPWVCACSGHTFVIRSGESGENGYPLWMMKTHRIQLAVWSIIYSHTDKAHMRELAVGCCVCSVFMCNCFAETLVTWGEPQSAFIAASSLASCVSGPLDSRLSWRTSCKQTGLCLMNTSGLSFLIE